MKYILACLWLLCYFPFVNSYVADQNQMVVLYLENLQSFENQETYQAWSTCVDFLDKNKINCCVKLRCQDSNIDDRRFLNWISMLEDRGHQILHAPNCSCVRPVSMNYSESRPDASDDYLADVRRLPISTIPESFKNQFRTQSGKNEILFVNGDPARWTYQQFDHFKSNVEYLIQLGIRFDIPNKSNFY